MTLSGIKRQNYIDRNKVYGSSDRIPQSFILGDHLSEILKLFSLGSVLNVCYAIEALEAIVLDQLIFPKDYFRDRMYLCRDCQACNKFPSCRKLPTLPSDCKQVDYLLDDMTAPRRMQLALRKFRLICKHMFSSGMFPSRDLIGDLIPDESDTSEVVEVVNP